jgi:hypothetical protein
MYVPPPPEVDRATLLRLLARRSESWDLDYKRQFRASEAHDRLELTKDIGAMMARGGHIVIGADDNGRTAGGLSDADVQGLDESRLRSMLRKYVPEGFTLYSSTHRNDGIVQGIIHVLPHPDGFCCFKEEGAYPGSDRKAHIAFRATVYVRHGSSSELATQDDLNQLIAERVRNGPAADRRPGWEFLTFIELLEAGLADHEVQWRDYRLGVTRTFGTDLVTIDDLSADVQLRTDRAVQLVSNLTRILTPEHSTEAFRTAAGSGEDQAIRYLADCVLDIYLGQMAWAAEIRGLRLDDDVVPVYELLAEMVEWPINEIRRWIAQLGLQVREAVTWLRSGPHGDEDEHRVITTELELVIDPSIQPRLDKELNRLRRARRRR